MTRPARKKSGPYGSKLAKDHADYLARRNVHPDIAKERGYYTVRNPELLLPLGFGGYVPVPGFVLPVMWNKEPVLHQFRPDAPRNEARPEGLACHDDDDEPTAPKIVKFERPKGVGNRLDCHPRMTPSLADPSVPLWIVEGIPKGDALASVGICAVTLLGVWNWLTKPDDVTSVVLPDWEDVALAGRDVYVAFDADAMVKGGSVELARQRLTTYLVGRGAQVRWIYLPDPKNKTGVDDFLAAGNSVDDLLALAGEPRYNIVVTRRQLPDLTREAIAALAVTNEPPRIFQRVDVLVEARSIGVTRLKDDRLRYRLAEAADWFRATKDDKVPASPPKEVVENVAVADDHWRFPHLDRIVTTPVFAADGTLRSEPGYHAASRSLYVPPPGLHVPKVAENPTKKDVSRARGLIDDLLCDFMFVSEADRAHAWALLLQPFARELIRGYTPLYGVEAPKQGSGKTVLVDSMLAPAVGEVPSFAEPHGDEEMEKRLTAAFRYAAPVVFFDNVTRHLHYPSLATALTKSQWQGRVLSLSETVQAPINCTFVLTANNPQYSDDLSRRVARIRLDTRLENPHLRSEFRHSLPAAARENRGELIWAACTLIRAWVVRGRLGPPDDVPKLVSYGAWRRVLGGVLALHDVPGFLGNLPDPAEEETSPEQEFLRWLFEEGAKGGRATFTSTDLALAVADSPDLLALLPSSRESVAGRIGKYMRAHRNQRVDGHVLEPAMKDKKPKRNRDGVLWQFRKDDRA